MAQISKGDTFTNGEQVTGARLNQLVDASTLLVGAITDQGALTAATVASNDLVLISDTSASALRKATVNDLLGSSLPVVASTVTATTLTTSVVNAEANKDIVITPNDGANVTGKTFSSGDGITATVASTAHGLTTGQNVTITASNSAYSGTYKIIVTTVDAFTYTVYPTTTAASGSCSYVREGTVSINGELNLSSGLNVVGASKIDGNIVVNGSFVSNGALTSNGTANFTGALQVNGTVGYVLTEIVEETISQSSPTCSTTAWTDLFTSASYVKPTGEIWVLELDSYWYYSVNTQCVVRFIKTSDSSVLDQAYSAEGAGSTYVHYENTNFQVVFDSSTSFTSTFKVQGVISSGSYQITFAPSGTFYYNSFVSMLAPKFRIYKYKTA